MGHSKHSLQAHLFLKNVFVGVLSTRKRSCGKVMFSQLCVCPQGVYPSTHLGRCYVFQHALEQGGVWTGGCG